METKRVIIATVLSLVVLLAWSYFFSPEQPTPPPATEQSASGPASGEQAGAAPATGQAKPEAAPVLAGQALFTPSGQAVEVDTPLYHARLDSAGAILTKFTLKKYRETIKPDSLLVDLIPDQAAAKAPLGLIWNGAPTWTRATWSFDGVKDVTLSGDEATTLIFRGVLGDLTLTRNLTFHADSYLIEETLHVDNAGPNQLAGRLTFTLASPSLAPEHDRYNRTRVAWVADGSLGEENDTDDLADSLANTPPVSWGGVMSNYFLQAVVPETGPAYMGARFEDGIYRVAVEQNGLQVEPQAGQDLDVAYYLGPKERAQLAKAPGDLNKAIHFGYFSVVSEPLLKLLNWFYGFVGNYGVAIILLTVLIKLVFWPLSQKSYKSMNKMKKIQPMMAKVREKYKDDREAMNREMMQLYKTYKVNPAGGCLPMVLQIPVFIGLYQALLGAIELRHAPFITYLPFTHMIWLADLSAKDPYYITPLIMGATMFLQQKLTPSPGDPTQAKIMLFMPIVFTFMFLNFPAGLVVYWLCNNVLSIGQQWLMLRKQ